MPKTVLDRAVAAMEQRYEAMTPLGDDWIHQCVAAVFEVVAKDMKNLLDIIGDDVSELHVFTDELKQQASAYPLVPPKWKPPNA
jgi:hypothetical protein